MSATIKAELKKINEEMDVIVRSALESNTSYEDFLRAQGKWRAFKSVRDRLSDSVRKREVPESDIDKLAEDPQPAAEPRRRRFGTGKARNW